MPSILKGKTCGHPKAKFTWLTVVFRVQVLGHMSPRSTLIGHSPACTQSRFFICCVCAVKAHATFLLKFQLSGCDQEVVRDVGWHGTKGRASKSPDSEGGQPPGPNDRQMFYLRKPNFILLLKMRNWEWLLENLGCLQNFAEVLHPWRRVVSSLCGGDFPGC